MGQLILRWMDRRSLDGRSILCRLGFKLLAPCYLVANQPYIVARLTFERPRKFWWPIVCWFVFKLLGPCDLLGKEPEYWKSFDVQNTQLFGWIVLLTSKDRPHCLFLRSLEYGTTDRQADRWACSWLFEFQNGNSPRGSTKYSKSLSLEYVVNWIPLPWVWVNWSPGSSLSTFLLVASLAWVWDNWSPVGSLSLGQLIDSKFERSFVFLARIFASLSMASRRR